MLRCLPPQRQRTSFSYSIRHARQPHDFILMKVTVLGCGVSTGVPAIGPDWGRCDPSDRRNNRRRSSVLIECRGKLVLIDTSPDLREQLIAARVSRLDA